MQKQIIQSPLGDKCLYAVLDNGLKVLVVEKEKFSSAYAVFGTHYGSIDTSFSSDGENFVSVPEGIAHFLEHKLFESEDGDAFTRFSKTGAYANAYTSFDRTCYLFSCSTAFYDNLDILLDFVQHPYFTAETVKKEQGIIGQEIKMYDDNPEWCVFFNVLKALYKNHPVKIDIAGTVESIAEIDDKLLYSCYNTFYNPSNMFVCIAGNVKSEEVLSFIEKRIKPSESINIIRTDFKEPYETVNSEITEKMDCAIPQFCYGYKLNTVKDVKQRIALNVALDLISGDFSPLYKSLTDEGLINDSFDADLFYSESYTAVLFQGESVYPKKVKAEIDRAVREYAVKGFDKDMFETAKKSAYGDNVKQFGNVKGISLLLTEYAVSGIMPFEDIKALKELTVEDVNEAVKLLDIKNSALSVIEKEE